MNEGQLTRFAKLKGIAPQFVVSDVVKTAEYYRDVLGFKILDYFLDPPVFRMVTRKNEVEIHFGTLDRKTGDSNDSERKVGLDAYVWVTDIDEIFRELRARGAEIVEGPVNRSYGKREFVVRDCNGFKIAFGR